MRNKGLGWGSTCGHDARHRRKHKAGSGPEAGKAPFGPGAEAEKAGDLDVAFELQTSAASWLRGMAAKADGGMNNTGTIIL